MAEENNHHLHIAMFPWLAFGHMIPYLELSKLLAQKGHKISFISTPRNIHRLSKLSRTLPTLLTFIELPLPHLEALPEEAEATSDLPGNKVPYLKLALDGLQQPLTHFLETSKPDWIVYDFSPYWLPPIASNLGISKAHFSLFTAAAPCFFTKSISALIKTEEDPRTKPEDFTSPPEWIPFPTNLAYKLHEAKKIIHHSKPNDSGVSDHYRVAHAMEGCDVIVARTCMEIEKDYIYLLGKILDKPVIPVGLLPPDPVAGFMSEEGEESWVVINDWLMKKGKGSVVYVAFGSEVTLSQEELTELALGLELSGLPFFWAFRKGYDTLSLEFPDEFLERTKGQGLVWPSWVPQVRILSHESVGGFLTHSGWNSIIEGLCFGRPLVMFPVLTDQGLNAREIEDKMVGLEIPRDDEDGAFDRYLVAQTLKLVLVEEKGQIYRDKAKEIMKVFGDKELHGRYVDEFVEYLINHKRAN